jgi:hypothetical protein
VFAEVALFLAARCPSLVWGGLAALGCSMTAELRSVLVSISRPKPSAIYFPRAAAGAHGIKSRLDRPTWQFYLAGASVSRGSEAKERIDLSQTIHDRLRDAQADFNKMLGERDRGRKLDSSKQTLNRYLDRWLELCAKPRLRATFFLAWAESTSVCWPSIRRVPSESVFSRSFELKAERVSERSSRRVSQRFRLDVRDLTRD